MGQGGGYGGGASSGGGHVTQGRSQSASMHSPGVYF